MTSTETERFRIALAQFDPTVGALDANLARAEEAWAEARAAGAGLVVLPELFLTGYPPQDLVLKPAFVADAERALERLAAHTADGPVIAVGAPWVGPGGKVFNCLHVLERGRVVARVLKHHLPNHSVFDEVRHFTPGMVSGPVAIGPLRIGFPICEDAWHEDVPEALAETGAELLVVANASPYHRGKHDLRMQVMVARVVESGLPLVYLNMVGGQDELVFDGGSFALNPGGELARQMPAFAEELGLVDLRRTPAGWRIERGPLASIPDSLEADYHAMVTGLGDYVRKSGFSRVVVGLSGGIDSALVATIATDALGAENVRGVRLPSRHSSEGSLVDAAELAENLGIRLDTVPISGAVEAVEGALGDLFAGLAPDVTEENIQARLRMVMLMAIANKFRELLLTTGNKSENAVGYATIYGDMAGAYNPLKDLYKTRVFATARWRNGNHREWMRGPAGAVIPEAILTKAPSAELRPGQTDEASLMPYAELDPILERLVERDQSFEEIVAAGFPPEAVKRVEQLLYRAEWKRFQAAPGTRITDKAFGSDRRYPIVNHWRSAE